LCHLFSVHELTMKKFLLLTLIILLFCCQNRYTAAKKQDVSIPQGKVIRITCKPSVSLSVYDTLVVEFTQYPGRAYTWYIDKKDTLFNQLKYIGLKTISQADLDDTPEKAEYIFLAYEKDSLQLHFKYQRPWERNKAAADSCSISVLIN